MPVRVDHKAFEDFEELQCIVQGGYTDVVPIGRGRMTGVRSHAVINPSLTVSSGAFSTGVRLDGVPSNDRWLIGMALSIEGPASAQSRELKPGSLLIVAPGQERYSTYQGAVKYAMTLVGTDVLEAHLGSEPGAMDALMKISGVTVLPNDPARTADRIEQMSVLARELSDETLPDAAVEYLQRDMLDLLTSPITEPIKYRGAHLRSADQLVRAVDHYIIETIKRQEYDTINIEMLAALFGTSKRTLHRAFVEVLGMPPISFLRNKRLGDVHTELRAASDPETLIANIARDHGFTELGRFAAFYRRKFGELPSETLRRRQRSA